MSRGLIVLGLGLGSWFIWLPLALWWAGILGPIVQFLAIAYVIALLILPLFLLAGGVLTSGDDGRSMDEGRSDGAGGM